MDKLNLVAGITCLLCFSAQPAAAATIYYDVVNISGNTWEYDYRVLNDSPGINIDEFSVYFDPGRYQNLSPGPAPAGWDIVFANPDNFLNNEGIYDALALVSGLAPGNGAGGFKVRFDFLDTGTPGAQRYEVVDPADFTVLASGDTTLVPLPAAIWLFGSGLASLLGLIFLGRNKTGYNG